MVARRDLGRDAYLDRLKVLLVATIIAVHGVVGYSSFEGGWAYQPVSETRLAAGVESVLGLLLLPSLVFAMGIFFLASGLVVPASVDLHGPGGFLRRRLVRLGVPYVVWVLVIWPAVVYAPRRAAGWTASYGEMFLGAEPFLDPGPMWFVGVLLLYSLTYAGWRAWSTDRRARHHTGSNDSGERSGPALTLLALAAGISASTVVVRLVFPFDSHQFAELQLWQWPQYVGLFGLGVVAARRGWLRPVSSRERRACGAVAVACLAVAFSVLVSLALRGLEPDAVLAGRPTHWAAITFAVIEGPLAVAASVWVLAVAQQRLDRPPGAVGAAVARSAYAAYLVQGLVLVGLALALRPFDLPAEVKALLVGVVGVVGSFAVAWLLVRRTPAGRVL